MASYLQPEANIEWLENGAPRSIEYQDIYCDIENGANEKKYVFIEGNRLAEKFSQLPESGACFCILETGFGFGLNFLQTMRLWKAVGKKNSRLHYLAIEKNPVSLSDFDRFYSRLDADIRADAKQLKKCLPLPAKGFHRRSLLPGIYLTLIYHELDDVIDKINARVDVWFLDGFKPSTNKGIWSPALFSQMKSLSRPGASLASYSVAGLLKRGLESAGFTISKKPGFGNKAEMLTGQLSGDWKPEPVKKPRVALVGAGMAGLFLATQLKDRGIDVLVVDQKGPMSGASGMGRLSCAPQLTLNADRFGRFSLGAFLYSQYYLEHLMKQSGVVKLAEDTRMKNRLRRLPEYFQASPGFLEPYTPVTKTDSAIYPQAGWVFSEDMSRLWQDLTTVSRALVCKLKKEKKWQLINESDQVICEADEVILAAGAGSMFLEPLASLPLHLNKGYSLSIEPLGSENDPVFSGPVSLFPTVHQTSVINGGYDHGFDPEDLTINRDRIAWILDRLAWMRGYSDNVAIHHIQAGWRCTSRDRRPLVDSLFHSSEKTPCDKIRDSEEYEGLWLCTAFGSHGLTHAPVCAEYLVSKMLNEPWPIDIRTAHLLSSQRFASRGVKKNHNPDYN